MARIEIDRLSDDASIWVFGISPALDEQGSATLLRTVDAFLDEWTAHNVPVTSGRELREGRFLVIGAEANSEKSGCSIDKLFALARSLEQHLGVSMLDASRVFFREPDGAIASVPRAEFAERAGADTIVFDTTAERLAEVRSGSWERPARTSWHAQLLRVSA